MMMCCAAIPAAAQSADGDTLSVVAEVVESVVEPCDVAAEDTLAIPGADDMNVAAMLSDTLILKEFEKGYGRLTLYDFPYSRTRSMPDWKQLWVNTGVLMGAGVATMLVLEALPKDATAWNKKANADTPLFKRWINHVKAGPVWDHDNLVFNYMLHPYAGAAYYMGARSCGFNCWGSFLYSFCISTFFWEYGFESFNEIPSVQDLVVTPIVGSLVGEGFYLVKRNIVGNGYRLLGSKVLGYAVAWLVDPLNETIGYFRGDQRKATRRSAALGGLSGSSWIAPSGSGLQGGISLTYTF